MRCLFYSGCVAAMLAGALVDVRAEFLNGIAAVVGDSVITVSEVKSFIEPALLAIERQYLDRPQARTQKQQEALEDGISQLVERQLILHDFKTSGRNLPESIIDDEINREIREQFGDRLTLTKTLQARGATFESFRTQTRERIIVSAMRGVYVSSENILVSPHKIEVFYAANQSKYKVEDQVKLRMIELKQPTSGTPGAAKRKAQEILSKIEAGTPFGEMTIYHEGSQPNGEWGWVERSVLRSELAEAAFKLKPGEHSGIIETPTSCYLMLVEDQRTTHVKPLSDVRDEIEKTLALDERSRMQKKWIDRLKKKSFVRYY